MEYYKIYITGEYGDIFIPVNPEEFHININGNSETLNVLGVGEVLIAKERGLYKFTWDSYLTSNEDDILINRTGDALADPQEIKQIIEEYIDNKTPAELTVTKYYDNQIITYIETEVYITAFNPVDKGGELADLYYTFEATEYREPKIIRTEIIPMIQEVQTTQTTTQTTTSTPQQIVETKERKQETPFYVGLRIMATGDIHKETNGTTINTEFKALNTKGTITKINNAGNNPYQIFFESSLKKELSYKDSNGVKHTNNIFCGNGWFKKSQLCTFKDTSKGGGAGYSGGGSGGGSR